MGYEWKGGSFYEHTIILKHMLRQIELTRPTEFAVDRRHKGQLVAGLGDLDHNPIE